MNAEFISLLEEVRLDHPVKRVLSEMTEILANPVNLDPEV
jgi:hypothetical protein